MRSFFELFQLTCLILVVLMSFLTVSCKSVKSEILAIPAEFDGVRPKNHSNVVYYGDIGLTKPNQNKPNKINVKSIPIKSRHRLVDSGRIVLELLDGSDSLYIDESKVLYNYASCAPFHNKLIRNAKSINGLVYAGNPGATKVQMVQGKVLDVPEKFDISLSFSTYILQIDSESYVVSWIDKSIAACEGNQSIWQIMDNLVIKSVPQEFLTICSFGTLPKDEIIVIKFARPVDIKSCFHDIKQAWRYDIEKARFVPKPHENLKCGIPTC